MIPQRIRPLAICVFRRGDRILVAEGHDPTKDETFYRPLGGEIEFGEYARDALAREIREEIGAEIANVVYLGTLENVFTYNGQPGHEIVLVFDARFVDESFYGRAAFPGYEAFDQEGTGAFPVLWKALGEFRERGTPLYPDGLLDLLHRTRPEGR